MLDLFDGEAPWQEPLGPGAVFLRRFASVWAPRLLKVIDRVAAQSPFRQMVTPGGHSMSVAMTSCGPLGWISSPAGYRYAGRDPLNHRPWPAMPEVLHQLAATAAAEAGYPGFCPDACLLNRYVPGAKLSLHQDKDEHDLHAPIVSVSLGLPAIFQFGGARRCDPLRRFLLEHGDVVVWGGPSRLWYHGIQPLKPGHHPATGECRYNLTFRRVAESE
ncbi:DNA oxidative demethylase AlkB [Erwinia sp. CPCC 100877]|nr:DNA oxidative demethylase AlkB [Erwinia sp. CPCC 100877]